MSFLLILRGVNYIDDKIIKIWVMPESNDNELGFLFLHELAHSTDHNKKMWHCNNKKDRHAAQEDADKVAQNVLGINEEDLCWRKGYLGRRKLRKIRASKIRAT